MCDWLHGVLLPAARCTQRAGSSGAPERVRLVVEPELDEAQVSVKFQSSFSQVPVKFAKVPMMVKAELDEAQIPVKFQSRFAQVPMMVNARHGGKRRNEETGCSSNVRSSPSALGSNPGSGTTAQLVSHKGQAYVRMSLRVGMFKSGLEPKAVAKGRRVGSCNKDRKVPSFRDK